MAATIGKSLKAHKAQSQGDAKRTRAVRSPGAAHITGAGSRGRPIVLRTIDEAAELLNVSPRTVRRLIESGALPVHRLRRLVRIADADLAALLAASRCV